MNAKDRRIAALRESITEVGPRDAHAAQSAGTVLLDVREPDEVSQGSPVDALRIGRGFLELRIEDAVPDKDQPIHVMCAGGVRSLFAAESLRQLGYTAVASVAGGFNQWKRDGLPAETPRVLSQSERERFGRHLLMPEVGEKGQIALLDAKVLVVGAGGLGSPAALYLAAAGVGTLGIVDDDVVDRSNLQRQVLHTDDRVGQPKVESARRTLQALNPALDVVMHADRLVAANVEEVFAGYDVILDGADNFATRYLVNDACVKLGLPNVHGSIFRFEGQVAVFWPAAPRLAADRRAADPRGPCYRCLFPAPPPPELAPSCAEAGVLGALPGIIGTLGAIEAIKLVLKIGDPLIGRMLHYDALGQRFTDLKVAANPRCTYCAEGADFPGYVDYEGFCKQP